MRYSELKSKLNVSDTSLVQRLNKLKNAEYITSEAKIAETEKNYFAYTLTELGCQLVTKLDITKLLEKVEDQVGRLTCNCSILYDSLLLVLTLDLNACLSAGDIAIQTHVGADVIVI